MAGRLTEVEQINLRKYHEEFEIPFWIWCSPIYKQRHRKIFTETLMARSNKFMTDDLPHLLLYLAWNKDKRLLRREECHLSKFQQQSSSSCFEGY